MRHQITKAGAVDKRWILVSNRLPIARDPVTGEIGPSSGGLVSAITGIKTAIGTRWVGAVPPGEGLALLDCSIPIHR